MLCKRADIDLSGPLTAFPHEEEEMAGSIDGHVPADLARGWSQEV